MRCRALLLGLGAVALALGAFHPAGAQTGAEVTLVSLDGVVDPLAARYVQRGLDHAGAVSAAAVLVRIDTPGGLDSSMRRIVQAVQRAPVPVVCWVGPSGSRAASAGAIVLIGCPVASMAPGTNVGAAHPVGFQGEILDEKVTNDAAAFARALAQAWGRDADFAEQMVRRSVSVPAEEALARKVIDLLAGSEEELLRALDGRPVPASGIGLPPSPPAATFQTAGARIVPFEMTFMESLLHRAIDPNLAFLLLSLGLLGIVVEILHPGIGVAGILGALAFLGALVILGMLPVNLLGVVLILLGVGFLVVEAYTPGLGIAGAAGVTALLLGGLFLFDASVPRAQVSKALVVGVSLALGAFFAFVVTATVKARRMPRRAATTADLVGEEGTVVHALEPAGVVRARNEDWTARAATGVIPRGARVRIVRVDGLTLEVEPAGVKMHEGGQP